MMLDPANGVAKGEGGCLLLQQVRSGSVVCHTCMLITSIGRSGLANDELGAKQNGHCESAVPVIS